jgi:hypothetical protein
MDYYGQPIMPGYGAGPTSNLYGQPTQPNLPPNLASLNFNMMGS